MDNGLSKKILFEIEQINQLINDSSPLFDLCKVREPDFIERCGIALILHSFYNGIVNILLLVNNNDIISGTKWHKDILIKAFDKSDKKLYMFRDDLKIPLIEYMQFRHFVRHTYGFQLKWEKMKNLLLNVKTQWEIIKEDINLYIKNN